MQEKDRTSRTGGSFSFSLAILHEELEEPRTLQSCLMGSLTVQVSVQLTAAECEAIGYIIGAIDDGVRGWCKENVSLSRPPHCSFLIIVCTPAECAFLMSLEVSETPNLGY